MLIASLLHFSTEAINQTKRKHNSFCNVFARKPKDMNTNGMANSNGDK